MGATDLRSSHRGAQRALAVILPIPVAAGLAALGDSVTTATSVLVLVLVVVAVGAAGDRVAGLLASVSSGLWFDFFLTSPTGQFAIEDPDDIEVTLLLVVVGVVVTEIALWGLRQQARAARRAGFLDGVLDSADLAAGGDATPDEARRKVADRITGVLGLDRCRFVPGPAPSRGLALLRRDGTVERDGEVVPVERDGLPTDVEICLPVSGAVERCWSLPAHRREPGAATDPGAAAGRGAPRRPVRGPRCAPRRRGGAPVSGSA